MHAEVHANRPRISTRLNQRIVCVIFSLLDILRADKRSGTEIRPKVPRRNGKAEIVMSRMWPRRAFAHIHALGYSRGVAAVLAARRTSIASFGQMLLDPRYVLDKQSSVDTRHACVRAPAILHHEATIAIKYTAININNCAARRNERAECAS